MKSFSTLPEPHRLRLGEIEYSKETGDAGSELGQWLLGWQNPTNGSQKRKHKLQVSESLEHVSGEDSGLWFHTVQLCHLLAVYINLRCFMYQ